MSKPKPLMADDLVAALTSLKLERKAPIKRRPRLLIVVAVLVALTLSVGLVVLARPKIEPAIWATAVTPTQIQMVSPVQALVDFSAAGYARTDVDSRVLPKVPGLVRRVAVARGDRVALGQVVYELDRVDHDAAIQTASSEASAAIAAAASARARISIARAELSEIARSAERARRLAAEGVLPTANAEDLDAKVASLKERLAAAEAEEAAALAQAKALAARTQALRIGLDNLVVVSPISGTVVGRPPQPGEYIDPQTTPGMRIADLSKIMVEVDVPEARLHLVRIGAPAEIVLDSQPDKRFRGEVRQVLPEVDRAKATLAVKVAFVDDNNGVLPEMSARVSFLTRRAEESANAAPVKKVVPAPAVVERAGTKFVFAVETDRVRMLPVKLGVRLGPGYELISGPPAGTTLVASPPATLEDGERIKFRN